LAQGSFVGDGGARFDTRPLHNAPAGQNQLYAGSLETVDLNTRDSRSSNVSISRHHVEHRLVIETMRLADLAPGYPILDEALRARAQLDVTQADVRHIVDQLPSEEAPEQVTFAGASWGRCGRSLIALERLIVEQGRLPPMGLAARPPGTAALARLQSPENSLARRGLWPRVLR
jgi:hypothetical protein